VPLIFFGWQVPPAQYDEPPPGQSASTVQPPQAVPDALQGLGLQETV
jgi:hypothetical protein